ncbi:protein kintoun, partial [Polymixia lowei]
NKSASSTSAQTKKPSTTTTKPTKSSKTKDSGDSKPKIFQIEPQKPNEPTIPNYTLKYRSFIDLQDFRCSRDSAQSPRPKEIVVTVDMPLLKSARDASLEVKGKTLLLETEKPAYRLEIPLAYSVDEDKGEAKFNKQNGQLTVILCVLPSSETLDFAMGLTQTGNLLKSARPTEEVAVGPEKVAEEEIDEDDLLTEQTFLLPGHNGKAPPALLRETDEHGKETVISDHSTSAGFTFQNSLLYELD